ncbi:aminopeptidase [Lachnospiraceae bacterium ZAX-1]
MGYREFYQPYEEDVAERFELVMERIVSIQSECTTPKPYCTYFQSMAKFIIQIKQLEEEIASGAFHKKTLEECKLCNHRLYADLKPENYGASYANPDYAREAFGEDYGKQLCFLYSELRAMIAYAFEERTYSMTILAELFVEIYNCFERAEGTTPKEIEQIMYWFFHDYCEVFIEFSIAEQLDSSLDFYTRIIEDSDLSDQRYLYRYGSYISENEILISEFLNTRSEGEIASMADTYTEGYRIGFLNTGKDLYKKKTVALHYPIGFERMMRVAIKNFEKMGLRPVISRNAVSSFFNKGNHDSGVASSSPNRQYDYDHKADRALYLDKIFVERRLACTRTTYEKQKKLASYYAGPAVVEVFGELLFTPKNKLQGYQYSKKQQKLNVYYTNILGQLTNEYIKGDERSFTIIAYPIPEIGEKFTEIFAKTVEINTLSYTLYQQMQQKIIDVLDEGEAVHITGKGANKTDLTVALYPLQEGTKETIFENCVADVNIPVGEVFTSPVLKGTNGLLHVTQVYLRNLKYVDLEVEFKDGMIARYSCKNFEKEEENLRFLGEELLHHHDTLPMGEFAIGTNTVAYKMGRDYGIADKLPILIAEKTGPHFAVGDTCYSHAEDTSVYNPDGKEIVARDNEISILRKEDVEKAYFNCHTDITIPYDELDKIVVIRKDKTTIDIISDGKFVVAGTEQLNIPLG